MLYVYVNVKHASSSLRRSGPLSRRFRARSPQEREREEGTSVSFELSAEHEAFRMVVRDFAEHEHGTVAVRTLQKG